MTEIVWRKPCELPDVGKRVLVAEDMTYPTDEKPRIEFSMMLRANVGKICSDKRREGEISWYSANYSTSYGDKGSWRMIAWAYIDTAELEPLCKIEAT